ncbi:hypothetical protein JH06_4529 [Blastocystis sp. subtype 4]|uniref:hypothetical protein n=1 Tax=Blastocystis sp. subtype 4 TaxID=944170 RepID=UPI0007120B40|nr:hypothetical protein JH06_4529 [Blastocystis sp. subtype 4]KNB41909.1 hypothetical protein JH06_4529 [Blastocystis sp. subtype 4]|eukprot:XP_014525352.1 hypothetical protein JH06_4529 [Blastocystis sp. subtype 4]
MDRSKAVQAIRKRLFALGCPFSEEENLLSKQNSVNIAAWLEDQCIRLYDLEMRGPLRTNNENWNQAFTKYLKDLSCPYVGNGFCEDNKIICFLWIASHAVTVEYEDNCDKYNIIPIDTDLSAEEIESLNELRDGLLRIASLMNVSIVDTNDISGIIDALEEEVNQLKSQVVDGKIKELPWKLEDLPITINTENPRLRNAMCVMECLYNEDVREIQDKINYIIEQVQILTAHPSTDASLGVVGFFLVCW